MTSPRYMNVNFGTTIDSIFFSTLPVLRQNQSLTCTGIKCFIKMLIKLSTMNNNSLINPYPHSAKVNELMILSNDEIRRPVELPWFRHHRCQAWAQSRSKCLQVWKIKVFSDQISRRDKSYPYWNLTWKKSRIWPILAQCDPLWSQTSHPCVPPAVASSVSESSSGVSRIETYRPPRVPSVYSYTLCQLDVSAAPHRFKSCLYRGCQIWHPNWVRLATNASQNILKLLLKSPRFVPFGANLTHFGWQIWHPCYTVGGRATFP